MQSEEQFLEYLLCKQSHSHRIFHPCSEHNTANRYLLNQQREEPSSLLHPTIIIISTTEGHSK